VVETPFKQLNALFDFVSYFVARSWLSGGDAGGKGKGRVNSTVLDATRASSRPSCAPSASLRRPSRFHTLRAALLALPGALLGARPGVCALR